jgi:vacuolar protein sorting-associated protein 13A/C
VPLSETKTFGFNVEPMLIVDMVMANSVKLISLESGVRVMNNTNSPVRLVCGPQELLINPRKSIAVPMTWVDSTCELHDGVNSYGLNLKRVEAALLLRLSDADVCLDQVSYLVDEGVGEVLVVQLNPSMSIKNCLPGTLRMVCEETVDIAEGEETTLRRWSCDETLLVIWELNAKGTNYYGKPAKLPQLGKTKQYAVRGQVDTKELLLLSLTTKLFVKGDDLDLRFKTITRSVTKALEVTASAQFIIVNQTDNSIELSPLNTVVLPNSIGLYATQDKTVKLRTVGSSASSWSPNINIDTPGIVGTVRVTHSNAAASDLGVSLIEGYGPCVLSKVIQIAPRFVLVNSLDIPIHFKAANLKVYKTVHSGGYEVIINSSSSETKTLQLSDDGRVWSESFDIEEIEDFVFKMRSALHGAAWYEPMPANFYHRFVRVTITTRNEATLLITLSNPSSPEFVVSNKTRDLLVLRQGDGPVWEIAPMTDMIYAYDNLQTKTKKVKLSVGRASQLYSFDKIKRQKPLKKYRVSVIPKLGQRILQVSYGSAAEVSSGVVEARSEFSVTLAGICLSVIDDYPKEILVLSLQRIAVKGYSETMRLDTDFEEKTGLDVSIGSLQLDNMLTHKQAYPVLFAPSELSMDVPYFQLGIHRIITTSESHRKIERFPLLTIILQETQIKIDYLTVMELSSKLIKLLESSNSNLDESTGELLTTEVNLFLEATSSKRTYFEVMQLGAVSLNLSIRVPSNLPKSSIKSNLYIQIQRSLLHIANISNCNLQFKSVILMHSYQTVGTLLEIIRKNYGRQAVFQFYKVLGSTDLLGNPIKLIDNLGTRVFEFFSVPYKGLIKRPDEFVGGVSKGIKSLVGNVLAGGLGSVTKIAGSLHNIVREVGGERKMPKKEKKGGILSRFKGGVLDVASGVSGLFSKPVQGAKKSGVKGFFKSMGTGVIGAESSPVTALLRVGGSVTQSLADSGENIKDIDPLQERGHVRHPRYFGSLKTLETYNGELAEAQFLLKNSQKYSNDSIQLLQTFIEATVILTDRNLLFLERGRLSAEILISTIQSITVIDSVKVLLTMDRKRVQLTARDEMQAAKLVLAVASLRNMQ